MAHLIAAAAIAFAPAFAGYCADDLHNGSATTCGGGKRHIQYVGRLQPAALIFAFWHDPYDDTETLPGLALVEQYIGCRVDDPANPCLVRGSDASVPASTGPALADTQRQF